MSDNQAFEGATRSMNKIDQLKQLRLEEETKWIDTNFVEQCATPILDNLVNWSNDNVFSKLGGELSLEVPLGEPNAGVKYKSIEPLQPVVVIFLSTLTEIYRDAMTFPLLSRRLVNETETLVFQKNEPWRDQPFVFATGVPELRVEYVHGDLSQMCETIVSLNGEHGGSRIEANDIRCRFVMFELMLVWTFFHEMGHVLQQHYRLRVTPGGGDKADVYLELDSQLSTEYTDDDASVPKTADLAAQARELMADAEAMDLTLKYLLAKRRLTFPVLYLVYCSVGCMYQRFYRNYDENLNVTPHRHPHPVLREEVSQAFLSRSIYEYLVYTRQVPDSASAVLVVSYLQARANLFTGLFRANRIEERHEASSVPSYMRLQSKEYRCNMRSYLDKLMPFVETQMVEVLRWHLLPDNRLAEWMSGLDAIVRNHGENDDEVAKTGQ